MLAFQPRGAEYVSFEYTTLLFVMRSNKAEESKRAKKRMSLMLITDWGIFCKATHEMRPQGESNPPNHMVHKPIEPMER